MSSFAEKKVSSPSSCSSSSSFDGTIIFPKKAKATEDVIPGKVGIVSDRGVFWRACCNSNIFIGSGQPVWVVAREGLTLFVEPEIQVLVK